MARRESRRRRNPSLAGAAKRGGLSEHEWADVARGARLARETGVTIVVHGVKAIGNMRKQHDDKWSTLSKGPQKPTESVEPTQPSTAADEASTPPRSKRKERSAQRLEEFLEKKRQAFIAELVARGCEVQRAQEACAHAERKRLERIAQSRAEPMEAESASGTAESAEPRRAR